MPSADRRTAIISAAQRIFVEKGFERTTTRSPAEAAGVSEVLLFKHFPNKEALYSAIQMSCFKEEDAKFVERLQSLEPSTAALVFLVSDSYHTFWQSRVTTRDFCFSASFFAA